MKLPKLKKIPALPKLNISQFLGVVDKNKTTIFIVAALAVVALNFVILPFAFRLDLSKNQANTLSPNTKKLVKSLNQTVKITLYQSSDLPSRFQPIKQDVLDLLNDYKQYGGSKIQFTIKDPKNNESAKQEAVQAGIPEIKFSQLEQDKFNVSTGYFGIVMKAGDNIKVIPQITDTSSIEYNLTSNLYSLTNKTTPKILINSAPPSFQQQDPMAQIRQILAQQYEVDTLQLTNGSTVPPEDGAPTPPPEVKDIDKDVKAVVISGNTPFSNEEVQKLNAYIENKGKVLAFIDGVAVNETALATDEATHNLFGLAKSYGITINKDLVLSQAAQLINFGNQVQSVFVPYPYWFKTNDFNSNFGYFSNVQNVVFPWSASLTLDNVKDVTTSELIKTDSKSWHETGTFIIDPQKTLESKPSSMSQFIVGAVSKTKNGGELMVIPSSRFINVQYLAQDSGNINFLLNVLNDYASDGALSGIRERSVQIYALPALSSFQKQLFQYVTIFLLPGFFGIAGALYLMKRK